MLCQFRFFARIRLAEEDRSTSRNTETTTSKEIGTQRDQLLLSVLLQQPLTEYLECVGQSGGESKDQSSFEEKIQDWHRAGGATDRSLLAEADI